MQPRDHGDRAAQVAAAFERAVKREREAIAAHDLAAQFHDAAAALNEQCALTEPDEARMAMLIRRAEAERDRAERARYRADQARQRLIAEGVAPAG